MKASAIKNIFDRLECKDCPQGVSINIDSGTVTTYFCICDNTEWWVDEEDNILQLDTSQGTEWLDIEAITRIRL